MTSAISYITSIPNRLTDSIGMYRLVTLSLLAIVGCSLLAGSIGLLAYGVSAQLLSLTLVVATALIFNIVCAKLWRVHANHESALITALILFFMVIPYSTLAANWALVSAGGLAILSKYIITYRKQHIFNAAAFGAVALVLIVGVYNYVTGATYNTDIFQWWVANPVLLWPVAVLGLLIVAKIRRKAMIAAFVGVGLVVFVIESIQFGLPIIDSTLVYFVSFPTLFLACYMLTEPFTMPPRQYQQVLYGGLVGALASTTLFIPLFAMTPELALVLGNAFAYTFRLRQKLFLELIEKREIAANTWELVFTKPAGFSFTAGQYVEWMLPHENKDSRGPRRYFTIASSPTEPVVRLALKVMPKNGSTYKAALMNMDQGDQIIVSQLAGDFVLPKDTTKKLGFIAGGIGVTPFSSHLSYMNDSGQNYDSCLYYCANTKSELAYIDTFIEYTQNIPLQVIPVIAKEAVTAPDESGFITMEMLQRRTPDYVTRHWFISGPPGMVNAYSNMLRQASVPNKQIETDFFPGLA